MDEWDRERLDLSARTIAVANQKGGVGKTATAVNISAALAEEGAQVLLVDLDSQASASSGVGISAAPGQSTYELLLGEVPAVAVICDSQVPGMKVAPASRDLAGAEVELVSMPDRHHRLKTQLEPVLQQYDYIVIDCPPALGMLTLNALCAADSVLVPLQCEFYALEGLSGLLDTITRVREAFNPSLALEGILLTMYDARTSLSRQVASEVRAHFGDRVLRAMVPRNVRVSEAPSHGQPVTVYDPASTGATAYRKAGKELIKQQLKRTETGVGGGSDAEATIG